MIKKNNRSFIPDGPSDLRERLEFLLDTSKRHDLEPYGDQGRFSSEWLTPDSRIRSTVYSRGFVLDELVMYMDFARWVNSSGVISSTSDARTVIDGFLYDHNQKSPGSANDFISFEIGKHRLRTVFDRRRRPVSAYSDARIGRSCGVIAAEAHNLARFLGIPNITIPGYIFVDHEGRDDVEAGHFFAVSKSEDGLRLWDPTNPDVIDNSSGNALASFHEPFDELDLADLLVASRGGLALKNSNLADGVETRAFLFKPAMLFPNALEKADIGTFEFAAISESVHKRDIPDLESSARVESFTAILALNQQVIDPFFYDFFEARAADN